MTLDRVDAADLASAARRLSERYRRREPPAVFSGSESLAYAAVRSPATFASSQAVFREMAPMLRGDTPRSQLDLGSGTGAAAWAAASVWSSVGSASLFERSDAMIRVGRNVQAEDAAMSRARWTWQKAELTKVDLVPHDLVTAAYALGELDQQDRLGVVRAAWHATEMVLVIIEPGTPDGFACIREIRDVLVGEGAEIIAPCPHQGACPMPVPSQTPSSWCHFSVRLNRSGLHRRMKDAELPFEDEKFSYIAFSRVPSDRAAGRIVGHPRRPPRRVELEVCAMDGLRSMVVPRSFDAYREAKRLEWGDAVPASVFAGRMQSRPLT